MVVIKFTSTTGTTTVGVKVIKSIVTGPELIRQLVLVVVVFQKLNPYLSVCPNKVGYFNQKMRFPYANNCIVKTTTKGSATRKRLGDKVE